MESVTLSDSCGTKNQSVNHAYIQSLQCIVLPGGAYPLSEYAVPKEVLQHACLLPPLVGLNLPSDLLVTARRNDDDAGSRFYSAQDRVVGCGVTCVKRDEDVELLVLFKCKAPTFIGGVGFCDGLGRKVLKRNV